MKKITTIAIALTALCSCSKTNDAAKKQVKSEPVFFKVIAINMDGTTITSSVYIVK